MNNIDIKKHFLTNQEIINKVAKEDKEDKEQLCIIIKYWLNLGKNIKKNKE